MRSIHARTEPILRGILSEVNSCSNGTVGQFNINPCHETTVGGSWRQLEGTSPQVDNPASAENLGSSSAARKKRAREPSQSERSETNTRHEFSSGGSVGWIRMVYVCVYIYIHIYIYIHVCVYI